MDALLESLRPLLQAHIDAEVRRQVRAVLAHHGIDCGPGARDAAPAGALHADTGPSAPPQPPGVGPAHGAPLTNTGAPGTQDADSQATQLPPEDELVVSAPAASAHPHTMFPSSANRLQPAATAAHLTIKQATLPYPHKRSRDDDFTLPDGTRSSFWDVGFPSDL